MPFNTIEYFVFFGIVAILYYLLPKNFQKYLLILASLFFYMYLIPYFILLVFVTALNDYMAGIMIKKYIVKKKFFLIESLVFNLGILFFFKYFNFFTQNINQIEKIIGWNYSMPVLNLLIPIGLSFYIFKSLSYVIDVFRGTCEEERNFGNYLLYVLLFPEICAGPIDRPSNLLPQINKSHPFDYGNVTFGLKLIAIGLFKKVVIADRLSISVNYVYNHLHNYSGLPLIITGIFFAFQIYCDFSGYSDIAIGSGHVLGLNLVKNFERPYLSRSISEFWRRWHISLSFWFRDYVFLPIAYKGIRFYGKNIFKNFNIELLSYITATSVTMFLIGLWHGANWTFIIWGLLIAFYLIFSRLTIRIRAKIVKSFSLNKFARIYHFIQILITFSLICFVWIFFRSPNINDALYFISHIFSVFNLKFGGYNLGIGQFQVILSFIFIIMLILTEVIPGKDKLFIDYISAKPFLKRWAFYYAVVLLIIFFGEFGENSFIYFKF